jgi:hypothetical protein
VAAENSGAHSGIADRAEIPADPNITCTMWSASWMLDARKNTHATIVKSIVSAQPSQRGNVQSARSITWTATTPIRSIFPRRRRSVRAVPQTAERERDR